MITISDRSLSTDGRASGFDYLRIILSVSVVLTHTPQICYGTMNEELYSDGLLRPCIKIIMPMFFALSGYLVAGSLVRTKTIGKFLGLRFIRIYPALAVEVILSALIMGPIFTDLSLKNYFHNHEFYSYLLNITGDIHYNLPGVFLHIPFHSIVNGQLWTIPYELLCYISLVFLSLIGIRKKRSLMLFIIPCGTAICFAAKAIRNDGIIRDVGMALPGQILVLAFLSGVTIYLYANVLPWNRNFAVGAFGLSVILLSIPNAFYLAPFPVAYLTVYLGLSNFRRAGFLKHADISYGIFLYGFVIQQVVSLLFPWSREWYINFLISMPFIIIVSSFSWYSIERPALEQRYILSKIEDWYLLKKTFPKESSGDEVRQHGTIGNDVTL